MSVFTISAYFLSQSDLKYKEKVARRVLRDHSNPLDLPEDVFISYYRINKEAFQNIVIDIKPLIRQSTIPVELKLAATLRFLAEGGFQRAIGKDSHIALDRTTVSKILSEMFAILERTQCPKWIKFERRLGEDRQSNLHFYNRFGIPGVIGCIDGTHIKLLKPSDNPHLYLNRKGCFSINAMVVCDYKMFINAVDACHPGSSHDSFVFSLSSVKRYLLSCYENGDHSSWLLGDAGYGLEPFLLTPYRNPIAGTAHHKFNLHHAKARNIVERVIGVLKSRFKCLQTVLPYTPQKVVKIINVCCALHNICRFHNLDYATEEFSEENMDDEPDQNTNHLQSAAANIREEIANNLMRTI